MIKLLASLLLLVPFALCSGIVVQTAPKFAFVPEGHQNLNLLCEIPGSNPIDFCIVKVPGVAAPFAASERLPTPVQGVTYFGRGWSKGSCGVTLAKVEPKNEGTFECVLSVAGQTYKGTIDIAFKVAPEPPVIEVSSNVDDSNGEFDYGKPLIAKCASRNGWPAAKLSWYLDGKPVVNELGAAFTEVVDKKATVEQFYRKAVAVEDNRKKLVCRAEHESYPNGFMEAALPVKLRKSNNNANLIQKDVSKDVEVKPSAPKLLVSSDVPTNDGSFRVGSTMVVECVARDGKPAATFLWFLDDQLVYEGLSTPFLTQNSRGAFTTQQVLQRVVKASDNGKTLVCKARHPSGTSETRLTLKTYS
ncbi:fasciclin-3 [Aedes aegypti]|uniref:Ig-like domain-containing protein n=1 Tax=Aedes aegypti TaxID=7159 RepID=A0A6I8T3N4_AEDAE|nr:fasciclin-3 [Aedes aegypti]